MSDLVRNPKTGFFATWIICNIVDQKYIPDKFPVIWTLVLMCQMHTVAKHAKVKHNTVKFLNFRTPENFAVFYLKFKQRGKTLGYFVKKMQME